MFKLKKLPKFKLGERVNSDGEKMWIILKLSFRIFNYGIYFWGLDEFPKERFSKEHVEEIIYLNNNPEECKRRMKAIIDDMKAKGILKNPKL